MKVQRRRADTRHRHALGQAMTIPFDPEIDKRIGAGGRFSGTDPSGGFAYDVDLSVPCLTTAIHAGHRVRRELLPLMVLSEEERRAEEDAATDRIIRNCPSIIWGLDSRAEYDLNRPPDMAVPLTAEMFWGTRVYASPPDNAIIRRSLEKYDAFYRFVGGVLKRLLDRFGACVVYDIHSYNIQRQIEKGHPSPPVFNLGTAGIDRKRWQKPVTDWLEELSQIALPGGLTTTVAENGVFSGLGEFCRRLTAWQSNILVLPTEISKAYMDEHTGVVFEPVVNRLRVQLAAAVNSHCAAFGANPTARYR